MFRKKGAAYVCYMTACFDTDCAKRLARKLNREDAVDCNRWRKQIKDG